MARAAASADACPARAGSVRSCASASAFSTRGAPLIEAGRTLRRNGSMTIAPDAPAVVAASDWDGDAPGVPVADGSCEDWAAVLEPAVGGAAACLDSARYVPAAMPITMRIVA